MTQTHGAGTSGPGGGRWGSRTGFILVTIGAAIGLGIVWRFSYVAGENGVGTFLIVYLCSVVLIASPVVIAELAVGRHARDDAIVAFQTIAHEEIWTAAGGGKARFGNPTSGKAQLATCGSGFCLSYVLCLLS